MSQIADLELQRRMWLDRANANPHWSYIEFVNSYPSNDELRRAREDGLLSPSEAEVLEGFHQILMAHKSPNGDDWDNAAIVNDPAWHRVVAAAQNAEAALEAIRLS